MISLIQGAGIGLILSLCGMDAFGWRFWVILLAFIANGIFENERGRRAKN
jgi:hypothetical protein